MEAKLFRLYISIVLLTAMLLALSLQSLQAAPAVTCNTVGQGQGVGNWEQVNNWDCGHVPGIGQYVGDSVVINNNTSINKNTIITLTNITINGGKAVNAGANAMIFVAGQWNNNVGLGGFNPLLLPSCLMVPRIKLLLARRGLPISRSATRPASCSPAM